MRDERTHPLLAQVPLTVSPFVTLPTATTLPYTYKTMPSTLPVPMTGITGAPTSSSTTSTPAGDSSANNSSSSSNNNNTSNKPRYVVSSTGGHAAHPDDIIASCRALKAHVTKLKEDADRELEALQTRIREAELAEKRRVAPGWLDSETHMLQPERQAGQLEGMAEADGAAGGSTSGIRFGGDAGGNVAGQFAEMSLAERQGASELDQGAELDRAFGGK